MEIKHTALAGTLESSDIQFTLSKGDGIEINLDSQVEKQFGKQIRKVITDILTAYDIKDVNVRAVDKGALDCTIKARLIAAIQRATDTKNQPNWEVLG
jgi:citrate lyase acyl carrier protein